MIACLCRTILISFNSHLILSLPIELYLLLFRLFLSLHSQLVPFPLSLILSLLFQDLKITTKRKDKLVVFIKIYPFNDSNSSFSVLLVNSDFMVDVFEKCFCIYLVDLDAGSFDSFSFQMAEKDSNWLFCVKQISEVYPSTDFILNFITLNFWIATLRFLSPSQSSLAF